MKILLIITALSVGAMGVNLLAILWLAARSGRLMDRVIQDRPRTVDAFPTPTEIASRDEVITLDC